MAHKDWCGKKCGECEDSCGLDTSIPCSPDCENLLENGQRNVSACYAINCDAVCNESYDFVKQCGVLLMQVKPHVTGCEYRLGIDMPESVTKSYNADDEYVLIKCVNGHTYELLISGNSLIATAAMIFTFMANR